MVKGKSETDIIEDIKKVSERINKIPTQKEYSVYGRIALSLVISRKPWNEWLLLIFNKTHHVCKKGNGLKVSDEDLLNNLKELYDKLGRAPKQDELSLGKYGRAAYQRAFGNFGNALKKIGLLPVIQVNLTNEDIINDIKRVSCDLGRTPFVDEFDEFSRTVSGGTVFEKFGSWNNALKEAGLKLNTNRNVTKEDIITSIHEWYCKNNKNINCLQYYSIRNAKQRGDFSYNAETISEKFDHKPWEEIMHECGYIEYKTVDQFYARGIFQGEDGNIYLSSIEKEVGDYMFILAKEKKIKNYEYEKRVCIYRAWTCDFVIIKNNGSEIWLEVDGMLNSRKKPYHKGHNEKIEYYKSNSYNYHIVSHRTNNIKKTIDSLLGD